MKHKIDNRHSKMRLFWFFFSIWNIFIVRAFFLFRPGFGNFRLPPNPANRVFSLAFPLHLTGTLLLKPISGIFYVASFSLLSACGGGDGGRSFEKEEEKDPFLNPPDAVSTFVAQPGVGQIVLSWTNPGGIFDRIVILRKTSAITGPNDLAAKEVYAGSDTRYIDQGLVNGRLYYYAAFSHIATGGYSEARRATATPVEILPPDSVHSLTATPGDGQVVLAWTNPKKAFDSVVIMRKLGSVITGPDDPDGVTEIYNGAGTEYTDTNLNNGTEYYYAVFTYTSGGGYSVARTATAIPVSSDPPPSEPAPPPIANLDAEPGNKGIQLSWTNPQSGSFENIVIFRTAGSAVPIPPVPNMSPADVTRYDIGTVTEYLNHSLVNDTTYNYAIFTYTATGGYSSPVKITEMPSALIIEGVSNYVLPDTGQRSNYTSSPGEDSEIHGNTMSYTDNGFTITDNHTKLVWEKLPDVGAHVLKTWAAAKNECNIRTTGGRGDWRLPTIMELATIVHYEKKNPAINSIFLNTRYLDPASYWSNNLYKYSDSTNDVRVMRFDYGEDAYESATTEHYVRCVSGVKRLASFNQNIYDIVPDGKTQLIWQKRPNRQKRSWDAALSHCDSLITAARENWRLPNIKELRSILDYDNAVAIIDTIFFPNTVGDKYWSSTTHLQNLVSSSNFRNAWSINFFNGDAIRTNKSNGYYVRCVHD